MERRGSTRAFWTTALLAALCLLTSGCNAPATTSPLKSLANFGSDAAIAKKAQSDPFPSAAQQGIATASTGR